MNPHVIHESISQAFGIISAMVIVLVSVGFIAVIPTALILNGRKGRKIR
jgi:hypothetical protein